MRGDGVDERAVLLEAVVQVRARREPGRAHSTDELALAHVRAGTDRNRGEMQVLRLESVGVAKVDHAPGAAAHSRGYDHAVGDGHYRRAGWCAVIDAEMRAHLAEDGMHAGG